MKPLLYGAPLSPFVRKIRLLLTFKGVEYDSKMIVPFSTPAGYEALNPLRRIPVLQYDGKTLADSAVIAHFLEATFPEPPLIPNDPYQRAHCEWLEKYADYELAPLTTFTAFRQRILQPIAGLEPDHLAITQAVEHKLPPLLDYLEQQLNGQPFFLGAQLTLADIAIASQLINFNHAGEQLSDQRWPQLNDFFTRFCQQPDVHSMLQQEQAALAKLLNR